MYDGQSDETEWGGLCASARDTSDLRHNAGWPDCSLLVRRRVVERSQFHVDRDPVDATSCCGSRGVGRMVTSGRLSKERAKWETERGLSMWLRGPSTRKWLWKARMTRLLSTADTLHATAPIAPSAERSCSTPKEHNV